MNVCVSSVAKKCVPATPIILVAAAPCCSVACTTTTQGLTTRDHLTHQGVVTTDSKEEGYGEEFQTFDLVDVNRGFWYKFPSLLSGEIKLRKDQYQSLIWSTITLVSTRPTRTAFK